MSLSPPGFFSVRAFLYIMIKTNTFLRVHLTLSCPVVPFSGLVPRMMNDLSFLDNRPNCGFLSSVCKPYYASWTKIMLLNKCLLICLIKHSCSLAYLFYSLSLQFRFYFLDIDKILFELENTIVVNGSCHLDLVPWK